MTSMSQEAKALGAYRTVAVVGISNDPDKPSNHVAAYLMNHGFNVIPVNPNEKEVLGKTSYADLCSIPEKIEIVDIFRRPEYVKPIVEDAVRIGAKVIWMQEGIVNTEAAKEAEQAGLTVIMDRCIAVEHARLMHQRNKTSKE